MFDVRQETRSQWFSTKVRSRGRQESVSQGRSVSTNDPRAFQLFQTRLISGTAMSDCLQNGQGWWVWGVWLFLASPTWQSQAGRVWVDELAVTERMRYMPVTRRGAIHGGSECPATPLTGWDVSHHPVL